MTIEPIRSGRKPSLPALGLEKAIPDAELTPRVRAALAALNGEVEMLRRDLETALARLEHAEQEADKDHLLPVLNRRAFVRELNRHIALASRYGTPGSLLYCDLDGFKRVNDLHGHAAGDAVLAHFARTLRNHVRDSDVVGRIGGDEFAVILAHASEAQAQKKAAGLLDVLDADPARWNGRLLSVRFSFGACEIAPGTPAETAIMRADEAMYSNKRSLRAAMR